MKDSRPCKEGVHDWCSGGERRRVSRAGRQRGDDRLMKITAAISAIINETQIVGEGSSVAVIGTRWWELRSHSTWSPGMKVAAFLIIDQTGVAPPDLAWITKIFTPIDKNLLAALHGRCVFLFLCLCGSLQLLHLPPTVQKYTLVMWESANLNWPRGVSRTDSSGSRGRSTFGL